LKNGNLKYWGSLVTVYIPTKNRSQMLKKAVLSVIKQSYPFIEIIIVDDNSEDDTEIIVEELKDQYSNLTYIKLHASLGASAARNIAIKEAKGLFLTGLDDDDEFFPDRIEKLIKAYKDEYSFVCTNYIKTNNKNAFNEGQKILSLNHMLYQNYASNQVFTKKERYLSVGGFDEQLKSSQDYDLWIRLIQKYGKALRLNQATYIWNVTHGKERITTSSQKNFGHLQFFAKHRYLMNNSHRKAQILMSYRNQKKPITICNFIKLISLPVFWINFKYLLLNLAVKFKINN
jgi:glycosyltransferase involved in cell wall biosynthesis